MVIEDNGLLSSQRYATEAGDQGLFALSRNDHLQALEGAIRRLRRGVVFPHHVGDLPFVLTGERFEQRCLHNPVQLPEVGYILGQEIILHESAIL